MEAKKIHVQDASGNAYDLLEIDGVTFPSYFAEDPVQRLKDVREMKGRDDDVIIVAYPKAGTHWVWEMTNMLARGSAEYHPAMKEAQMMELSDPRDAESLSGAESLTSPRVFNTHLRFRQLPKDMINRNCKLIYVIRNPKDMAVSRYVHNSKGTNKYGGSFADYLQLYMEGKVAFGSWFDYTMDWHRAVQDNPDYPIYTVCYEDLKKDSINQVQKLAEFLQAKSDTSFIQEVCDRCNFSNLKTSYEKNKQAFDEKDKNPLAYTFRKGEIGDWKNWFTVAQSELFDAHMQQKMAGYTNTFTYQ